MAWTILREGLETTYFVDPASKQHPLGKVVLLKEIERVHGQLGAGVSVWEVRTEDNETKRVILDRWERDTKQ